MPLDSVCLAAVRQELTRELASWRVDKLQQPERDEVVVTFRGQGPAKRLLLCAGSGDARAHLTDYPFENPAQAPMFCMLLRKHLSGARLLRIDQPPMERVLDFAFSGYDALGDETEKHLILELVGRFSNLILTEGDGLIVDCLRRIDSTAAGERPVLPGLRYRLPPGQGKKILAELSREQLAQLCAAAPHEAKADRWLLETFSGLSPMLCRELALSALGDWDVAVGDGGARLAQALDTLHGDLEAGRFTPCLLTDGEGREKDFACFPPRQYGELYRVEKYDSFSKLLSDFYTRRDRAQRMGQRAHALNKTVRNLRDRTARKLDAQRRELEGTKERERARQFGDMITANLYRIQKGQTVLETEDYYSEDGALCAIPLDPLRSPQQNAAKYYKDYTKARNAEKILTEQIEKGERELDYLDSVLDEIARAETETGLQEIRQELEDAGVLRRGKTKQKRLQSAPLVFKSSSGMTIRVGRNNAQNDALTLKQSRKTDLWLHVQKIHGSHVVVSADDGDVDEQTLLEAASLAAYFSQAREGKNVPVDYAQVKFVKKPSGAKPGMVIYMNYKTVYVDPDERLVKTLSAK